MTRFAIGDTILIAKSATDDTLSNLSLLGDESYVLTSNTTLQRFTGM